MRIQTGEYAFPPGCERILKVLRFIIGFRYFYIGEGSKELNSWPFINDSSQNIIQSLSSKIKNPSVPHFTTK